jgi:chromosome segregation ATPase
MFFRLLGKAAGKVADVLEPMATDACAQLRAEQLAKKQHTEELEERMIALLRYSEELEETNATLTAELENERERCERQITELGQLSRQYSMAAQASNGWREQCAQLRTDTKAHADELEKVSQSHRGMVEALSDNAWHAAVPHLDTIRDADPIVEIYSSLDAARAARPNWYRYRAEIK